MFTSLVCKMPRKCCTFFDSKSCKSNYDGQPYVSIYSFPSDADECERWVKALPNQLTCKVSRNIGVCAIHWPPNFPTVSVKGKKRPRDPPTLFGSTPSSFVQQSPVYKTRDVNNRLVTAESRLSVSKKVESEFDTFSSWKSLVEFCKTLNVVVDCTKEHSLLIMKIDDGIPPQALFSIVIDKQFHVKAFRENTPIVVRDLIPSFSYCLTKKSQLTAIITRLENSNVDLVSEMKVYGQRVIQHCKENQHLSPQQERKVEFLGNQLMAHSLSGYRFYDSHDIKEALELYLRSRSCYRAAEKLLSLPTEKTIRSYFGEIGSPGSENDCQATLRQVFSKLSDKERFCFITVDEITVKPALRYRANHIIGHAIDSDSLQPAKKVLAMMINPSLGAPPFVARLIPVFALKGEFLYHETLSLLQSVHFYGGHVFMIMSDNLRVNQKMFKLFHANYESLSIFSTVHPVEGSVFSKLYLLYDFVHELKNIRNNWLTEKTQTLIWDVPDSENGKSVSACWSDIVDLYQKDCESLISMTKLSYQSIWPNSFEKQKVNLVLSVFDEKVVAFLKICGYEDTALFVENVLKTWNILNVKSRYAGVQLNDPTRKAIESKTDERLVFLEKMATSFKLMDRSKQGKRVKGLTSDTANALHVTLLGLVDLTKTLLDSGFEYVLLGKLQSDRLELEFSKYRQASGGNFFISVEQVVNALALERLKLFNSLDLQNDSVVENCCELDIRDSEDDLNLVVEAFGEASNLTKHELSVLYYISGYVTCKENLSPPPGSTPPATPASEFTEKLSRGKLSHPSATLFDLSQYFYAFFKLRSNKCCNSIFLQAFEQIFLLTDATLEGNIKSVSRRFVNCFFKAHAASSNTGYVSDKKKIKSRRISSR